MAGESKIYEMDQALELIRNNAVIACSGFGMAAMPEEILQSLEKRFIERGSPRALTIYNGSGLSDSNGSGTDHLALDGLIKRVVAGFFGTNLRLGEMIRQNRVEAYNFPQGAIMNIFRECLRGNSFYLSKIGLETFADPRLEGGRMNERAADELVRLVCLENTEFLSYEVPRFEIGLIRGTVADTDGNICVDEEVVRADSLVIAMAVRACGGKVIAQVKHIVPSGSLSANRVYIPGIYVDAVVRCTDPIRGHRPIGNLIEYDPSLTGHIRMIPPVSVPLQLSAKKIIARRAAMEMRAGDIVNLGIGTPEFIAAVAEEEGVYERIILTAESGVIGGIPCGGADFGASRNPLCLLDEPAQFDFYDGGGLDISFLGFAQADMLGNVNISRFGAKVYGCGGAVDISQNTRRLVFCGTFTASGLDVSAGEGILRIIREGREKKFLRQVGQITYSGPLGQNSGQEVLYITERAIFRLIAEGLELAEIAPGVDLEKDILDQMDFTPIVPKYLRTMNPALFSNSLINLSASLS